MRACMWMQMHMYTYMYMYVYVYMYVCMYMYMYMYTYMYIYMYMCTCWVCSARPERLLRLLSSVRSSKLDILQECRFGHASRNAVKFVKSLPSSIHLLSIWSFVIHAKTTKFSTTGAIFLGGMVACWITGRLLHLDRRLHNKAGTLIQVGHPPGIPLRTRIGMTDQGPAEARTMSSDSPD